MASRTVTICSLVILAASALAQDGPTPPAVAPAVDLTLLSDLAARNIGPAVCGGRIGAVAGVPGDPKIVWVGAASGGVWKSTDGGVRFQPVFDDQDVTSIGAIAIDPRSPDVVWIGTGEGNPRNSASVGRGLYRTRDGGQTWQKLGLEKTEHIHRILLHPTDPDTAFVAAFGTTWGENEERGVFRTRDGGKTWQKVLYVDERTGCGDLVMDPRNPDKLFANMWEHRRWPWSFKSGGPGSGLHRTLDGGETWTRLTEDEGMPAGELGRIGLAIAASDPRVVYALVEAKKSVLLRSDDGGFHFRTQNSNDNIASRPFYFGDIRVDPQDQNRVYNLHTVIDVSTDGGRSFGGLVGWGSAHPDHHTMWIDPTAPERIVIGNDGGVYTSLDRGNSWRFCANLPVAQFYHVATDQDVPYHVYGGLQDNGSWRGPSNVWENGGIRNFHWQEVCFGDGFATLPDPQDSMQGYAMSQGGSLVRWNLHTGASKFIQPPAPAGVKLRFHWNSAIAQDPFDPRAIYYGSQFLHRSTDRGESWTVMSPDLTTDNPEWQKQDESGGLTLDATGAENHCTILTIAPSPVQKGVVWIGSDDGRVHVTQNGGESWRSVEHAIPGLPLHTWCPHIEASKFDAGTAYAVFDGHRHVDWTPYVYKTNDFGATWSALATPALDGYCLVIEQDPVQKDLLWVGTEFGLYVSFDGGTSWQRWKHGVPTCSAMAITTQAQAGDLIVATHGRSIFVIDDLTPLRTMTPELLQQKLHLFPIQPAIAWETAQSPSTRFPGNGEFRGETRQRGAFVNVITNADELKHADAKLEKERAKNKKPENKKPEDTKPEDKKPDAQKEGEPKPAKEAPKDKVTIEVRDAAGTLIRTFRSDVHLGLNRIVWGLDRDGTPGPSRNLEEDPELPPSGREVLPGEYTLTVTFQGESRSEKVLVQADPRMEIPMADREAKDALRARREALQADLRVATQRYARSKRDLDTVEARLDVEPKVKDGETDPNKALRDALGTAKKAAEALEERIWGKKAPSQGISEPTGLFTDLYRALRVTGTDDAPNPTELQSFVRGSAIAGEITAAIDVFVTGPLVEFRAAVTKSGIGLLQPVEPDPAHK
jgi:photosystem II stability/assembly factor-like uncharacterized protein